MDTEQLIGAHAAAERLGMTHGGLTAAVRDGRIKPAARIGARGTLVFDVADLDRQAAERRGSKSAQ